MSLGLGISDISRYTIRYLHTLLVEVRSFYWDDPYLFNYYPDQMIRRCVINDESMSVLKENRRKTFAVWNLLAHLVQRLIIFVILVKDVKI